VIGTKGYVGLGGSTVLLHDMWEFDPAGNRWTRKADFPGALQGGPFSFAIGNKAYVGAGTTASDVWEFDPAQDQWMRKADFPGTTVLGASGFSIGGKG
jgi:N-acetylneuraminic acid mutarotase